MISDEKLTAMAIDSLFDTAERDLMERDAAIGKLTIRCFYCGNAEEVGACGCKFESSFGCAGRRTCHNCKSAMETVEAFLTELFAARRLRVDRVNSIRCRLFRTLRTSLSDIGKTNPDELMSDVAKRNPSLFRLWDRLTDIEDETRNHSETQEAVLAAFREADFRDWLALARAIDRRQNKALTHAVRRYFQTLAEQSNGRS